MEDVDQVAAVVVVERRPVREPHPGLGQGRDEPVEEDPVLAGHQLLHPAPDDRQLLAGAQAVERAGAHPGRHLVLEAGHPHLEELVEQLGEDGHELDPLEEGHLGVVGEVEQAGPEVQPRQLPVGEPLVAEGGDVRRRRRPSPARSPTGRRRPGRTGGGRGAGRGSLLEGQGSPSTVRRVSPERTTPRYAHGVAQTAVRRPPATWRAHPPPAPVATGDQAASAHRAGPPVLRRRDHGGLLRHRRAGGQEQDPAPPRADPRRHPGALPRGPPGQPLAGPERQRRGPARSPRS